MGDSSVVGSCNSAVDEEYLRKFAPWCVIILGDAVALGGTDLNICVCLIKRRLLALFGA